MKKWIAATVATIGFISMAHANETLTVPMQVTTEKGPGDSAGSVTITTSPHGLVFTPHLTGLEPGIHGFHIHAKASCDAAEVDGKNTPAGAAGGHWDSENTGKHGTPWGDGHIGDLPALYVMSDGTANQPVLAPRLKDLDALKNHALMIHAGGDNHADQPKPLGGGGARMACGVIK
ncbi:Cu-Zn family superoxide dismutase [Pseudomonas duriflava]|uniref:Superoxide dismutase [Cu-Zn] n=1 Tax=Pseudomonas duriflava TaxID=459528 RepID=A0A562QAY9_9PSED|nr:superoxide dismutase family protein [Pseudomonas duriflava]TWI53908.1 Cu-Zn family superoxide dismutase [Pseudomonas duriflava]